MTGDPIAGWYPVSTAGLQGWIAGSLLSGPGIPDIAQLCGLAEGAAPAPQEAPAAPAARAPIGQVSILGAEGGADLGQGFSSGNCTNWKLGVVNQSDTAISGFTFAPPSGNYSNGYSADSISIPVATPVPAQVDVYVAPGTQTRVTFQVCTSTPPPTDPGFELGMVAPDSATYHWVTGQDGISDFGW